VVQDAAASEDLSNHLMHYLLFVRW
jgi:hypothetical protein